MATKFIKLEGELMWAKVFKENRDLTGWNNTAEATDGQLSVDLILDEDEYEKLNKAGSQKYRPKDHNQGDGTFKVKFTRPWFKEGQEWACGAIPVHKADGSLWDYSEDGVIWNGSKGIVQLAVYDIKKYPGSKGTRLDAITVVKASEPPEDISEKFEGMRDESEEVPF